ncbi:restriction endonuclease subunit S [Streptomyces sp. NBC_01766]|uniref:restriction endonuclease subunit S n=1 Tax=Streptomyces sp. NBC_01766 TaxID=2975936 RepID=UPI002DDA1D49|nr:restriction endonuclease subunit S [Streptomyces sp. NBC_01766]WSC21388.1 restriction endonuclease subunit S [Streptomyces sp. NBC_01766]
MSAEPDEIRWVPVGEVGEVRMGKQLSPASRDAAGQVPYLRVANVFEDRIDYRDVNSMGFTSAEKLIYGLRPGDILLNEGQESLANVGRSAIYEGALNSFCFQNTLIRFRPGGEVVPEYAQAVFVNWRRMGGFARVAEKTSISHLGGSRFAKMMFPLIPLREQQRIVEILDSITEVGRASEAAIAKLQTLRDAAVHGELMRLRWSFQLRDALLGEPRNGFSPLESAAWTGTQMLGLGCLTSGGFVPRQLKNAPSGVRTDNRAILRDGDLLVSRANTRELVGLCGIYRDVGTPCIYPDLMMRIRPKDGVSADYLEMVVRSERFRRGVRGVAQGTSESMVKISSAVLQSLAIPLPGMSVQDEVIGVLRKFNDRISAEVEKLRKVRLMRYGLIEYLLSGNLEGVQA